MSSMNILSVIVYEFQENLHVLRHKYDAIKKLPSFCIANDCFQGISERYTGR